MSKMSVNEVSKKIDEVVNKHKMDEVSPFDTNFVEILNFLKNYIWDMEKELSDLKKELKMTNDMVDYERKEKEDRGIDTSAFEEMSAARDEMAYDQEKKEAIAAFVKGFSGRADDPYDTRRY